MKREHTLFGSELGDMSTRLARLEKGLEVITGLFQSDAHVSLTGTRFRLQEAALPPHRPARQS